MPTSRVVLPWLALLVLVSLAGFLFRLPDFGLPRLLLRFVAPLADVEPVTTTLLIRARQGSKQNLVPRA